MILYRHTSVLVSVSVSAKSIDTLVHTFALAKIFWTALYPFYPLPPILFFDFVLLEYHVAARYGRQRAHVERERSYVGRQRPYDGRQRAYDGRRRARAVDSYNSSININGGSRITSSSSSRCDDRGNAGQA